MITKIERRCRELAVAGLGARAHSTSALRLAGLLLVCLHALACADILGIDEPQARLDGRAGASEAGSAGAIDDSTRPLPTPLVDPPAPKPSGVTGHLVIKGPKSVSGCPNSAMQISLSVSGGQGKYSWAIEPADPSFAVKATGTHQEQAVLTGPVGTKPHQVSIRVTDENGVTATIATEVDADSVPVIDTPAVGSICPDELYAFDFHAAGGDEQHYVWSSEDFPTTSGLALTADGHLAGKFADVPVGPSQLKFTVKVADGSSCAAEPVKVSLAVSGAGAQCPVIGVKLQAQVRALPPLCLGGEYNEQLVATGGEAPYTWTHGALPNGLSVDGSGKLSGTYVDGSPKPLPPAAFAIQVTDHQGRRIERSELVPVREKCWFAYIASSGAAAQLNFFDPLLGNRKTPPQAGPSDVVTDFKFSPNGRYVAYRLTTPAVPAKVSVVDLSTWQQNAPYFPDASDYAWASDSGTLAVAYKVGGDTALSGLAVAHPQPSSTSVIVFPPLATVVTPVNSALAWFGPAPEQLAMIANFGALSVLKTFSVSPTVGFDSPVVQTDELPFSTWLLPARSGVFAVHPIFETVFYPSDGSFPAFHDNVVIAPSGEYVARADTGSLNVFRPFDDSLDIPPFSKAGCDSIASWASGKERIACAHQTSSAGGEVTFFDLAAGTDPDLLALTQLQNATIPLQVSSNRRRLFSPSGSLFAFANDQAVAITYLQSHLSAAADVNASTVPSTSDGAAYAELAFTPDEKRLLQHRGSRLSFFDLSDPNSLEMTMSSALAASQPCDEDFRKIRDASAGWCGAERPDAPFWRSPGSDLAAFQTADGTLHIYSFDIGSPFPVDDQCGQGCIVPGQIGFQP